MRASVLRCVLFLCSFAACGRSTTTSDTPPATEIEGIRACAPLDKVGAGASTGSVSLSGHVYDSSGRPIVGAEVRLRGDAEAVRYTSFVGAYEFRLSPGSYDLETAGDCALDPPVVTGRSFDADATQDFVAADSGCVNVEATNGGQLLALQGMCMTIVSIQEETSHDAAIERLEAIVKEQPATPACTVAIDGHSAVERVAMISTPGPLDGAPVKTIAVTTGIAIDATVVRFESSLAETASLEQVNFVLAAGRNFTGDQLLELHAN